MCNNLGHLREIVLTFRLGALSNGGRQLLLLADAIQFGFKILLCFLDSKDSLQERRLFDFFISLNDESLLLLALFQRLLDAAKALQSRLFLVIMHLFESAIDHHFE